jgi:hypothetical protein
VKLVRTGTAGVLLLQHWRSGRSPAFRPQAGAQFDFLSTTFNVRGLAFPIRPASSRGAILIGCSYLFIAQW